MRKTPPEAPGDDTPPPADTPIADSTVAESEPVFHPDHEWPSSGGCYVRQTDGTLKRED